MNTMYKKIMIWLLALLIPFPLFAADNAAKIQTAKGKAEVTFLQGNATLVKQGSAQKQPLSRGDMVSGGDRISTAKGSRMELRLPDNSYLRFDENTTFVLESVSADKETGSRDINVKIMLGKTWAKVSRMISGKGKFAVSTKTAVAGVRGTDFRMDVNSDNSAVLKVYSGAVEVSQNTEARNTEASTPSASQGILTQPRPIAGPHPVSMKEWTYIVSSLQQISIAADGTATKPFRFDIAADLNEWVRWNQLRDEQIRKLQDEQMRKVREEQIRKIRESQLIEKAKREEPAPATEVESSPAARIPETTQPPEPGESVPDGADNPPPADAPAPGVSSGAGDDAAGSAAETIQPPKPVESVPDMPAIQPPVPVSDSSPDISNEAPAATVPEQEAPGEIAE